MKPFLIFSTLFFSLVVQAETQHSLAIDWLSYDEPFDMTSRDLSFQLDEYSLSYSASFESGLGFALSYLDGGDSITVNTRHILEKELEGVSLAGSYLWDDSWMELGVSQSKSHTLLDTPLTTFDYDEFSESLELFFGYGREFELGNWIIAPFAQLVLQRSDLSLFRRDDTNLLRPNVTIDQQEQGGFASANISSTYPVHISQEMFLLGRIDLSWSEGIFGDGISRSSVFGRERSLSSEESFESDLDGSGAISLLLALYYSQYGADISFIEPLNLADASTQYRFGISVSF